MYWQNILPKPKCALTPPRFLTRNSPDFLKLQFKISPKSDSNTQVPYTKPNRRYIKDMFSGYGI